MNAQLAQPGARIEPPDPPGWRRIAQERIPIERLTVIVFATIPLWTALFVLVLWLTRPGELRIEIGLLDIIIALTLILAGVPLLHEGLHGLAAWLVGVRPSYGFELRHAYTTFTGLVSRGAYLFIGLAPLVGITVGGLAWLALVPFAPGFTLLVLIVNAAGSVGDLWIAWRVLKLPPGVRIYDLVDGYAAYLPPPEAD